MRGRIQQEGKVGSTQRELDCWMKTLPQPWSAGMEATIFSGWNYDHLLPHATQIKVAHPMMLRAIAAAKEKNDQIDARKIADCLRCDFLPESHMMPAAIRDRRRTLRYRHLLGATYCLRARCSFPRRWRVERDRYNVGCKYERRLIAA